MKKTLLYFSAFILALGIAGCTKTTEDPFLVYCNNGIKDHGESEVDCGGHCTACIPQYLTANIQGLNFSATNIVAEIKWPIMRLAANDNAGNSFTVTFSNPTQNVGQPKTLNSATLNSNDYYLMEPGDTSSVIITKIDTSTNRASGTFSFSCTRGGGTEKKVFQNGSFTDVKLTYAD